MTTDDPVVAAIAALVRSELQAEAAAGFPTLARIPSSGVVRLLDYLVTLSADEHAALLGAQPRATALLFRPGPTMAAAFEGLRTGEPALRRRNEALQALPFAYGLRYADLRMAKATLGDPRSMRLMAETRAAIGFVPRDDPPEALVGATAIRDVVPAKAPLLRKLLDPMLCSRLSTKAEKRVGGELVYRGAIGEVPLTVSIIFSNRFGQLHYGATCASPERGLLAHRLTYEGMWGMNTGWDYLTEENASRSIALLDTLLLKLAGLFERVGSLEA